LQGRNEGGKGDTIPAANHYVAPNHCGGRRKVSTVSQVLYSITSERPQVRTWGRQTCFSPRASSNLVTPM